MTSPTPQVPAREAVELPDPHVVEGHYRDHMGSVSGWSELQVLELLAVERDKLERIERNRDMWKEQCRNQAESLAANQEELDKMRADAERFAFMSAAMVNLEGPEATFLYSVDAPKTIEEIRSVVDQGIAALSPSQGA